MGRAEWRRREGSLCGGVLSHAPPGKGASAVSSFMLSFTALTRPVHGAVAVLGRTFVQAAFQEPAGRDLGESLVGVRLLVERLAQ
jgi:hypothetical protein